jgi:hypothetical protein
MALSSILSFSPTAAWNALGVLLLPTLADLSVRLIFFKKIPARVTETTSILAGVATYTFLVRQFPADKYFKIAALLSIWFAKLPNAIGAQSLLPGLKNRSACIACSGRSRISLRNPSSNGT